MNDLTALSTTSEKKTISAEEISGFADSLQGDVITPDNREFEEQRAIWNGLIVTKPAMIAKCKSADDVIAAVKFARKHDLLTSTRSGGHHVAGGSLCKQGLVVDMSEMNAVDVDPKRAIAKVGGGAKLGDVDKATAAHGLAAPLGVVSRTGVAGLTLHGGFGYQSRKRGLALDNLNAIEIVTADGQLRRASEEENSDLFWALRGGGGNFGVVTSFEFKLFPMPEKVWLLLTLYPATDGKRALEFFRSHYHSTSDEFAAIAVYWSAPDEEFIPQPYRGKPIFVFLGAYTGSLDEGEKVIKPYREVAEPIIDLSEPKPFPELQQTLDEDYPNGRHYYWKSVYINELSDNVLDIVERYAQSRPSPLSSVDVWGLGGAVNRVPEDETAFSQRSAPYMIGVEANWDDQKDDDANIKWARGICDELMATANSSSYLNFPGFVEEGDDMLGRAYGGNYRRLKEIKSKYDPDNFFRGSMNIRPKS
jgi:FAD/FMN-containing dehydrogenase